MSLLLELFFNIHEPKQIKQTEIFRAACNSIFPTSPSFQEIQVYELNKWT